MVLKPIDEEKLAKIHKNKCQFLIGMVLKHYKIVNDDEFSETVSIPHRYGT